MNLQELLTKLETPIVIRPTRRMTQGELETYLDKAAARGCVNLPDGRAIDYKIRFSTRARSARLGQLREERAHQPELQAALPPARAGALRDGSRDLPLAGSQPLRPLLGPCARAGQLRGRPSRKDA